MDLPEHNFVESLKSRGVMWRALIEVVKYVLIAIAIVVPLRFFIAQPFVVSGYSMTPTFGPGEYLVIDEMTYRSSKPAAGDVVVLRYPLDPSIYLIKRVIAVPAETIKIQKGVITVYNKINQKTIALTEPYKQEKNKNDMASTTLDGDEYFVMGDNRDASSDSRTWGPLQERFIIGRVAIRLFPFDKMQILPGRFHL